MVMGIEMLMVMEMVMVMEMEKEKEMGMGMIIPSVMTYSLKIATLRKGSCTYCTLEWLFSLLLVRHLVMGMIEKRWQKKVGMAMVIMMVMAMVPTV